MMIYKIAILLPQLFVKSTKVQIDSTKLVKWKCKETTNEKQLRGKKLSVLISLNFLDLGLALKSYAK